MLGACTLHTRASEQEFGLCRTSTMGWGSPWSGPVLCPAPSSAGPSTAPSSTLSRSLCAPLMVHLHTTSAILALCHGHNTKCCSNDFAMWQWYRALLYSPDLSVITCGSRPLRQSDELNCCRSLVCSVLVFLVACLAESTVLDSQKH